MPHKRRSGRIAKQLPIVLLGSDTAGKVFAEETKTVVLSRHGAGVLSKYRFAPDEVLTLRMSGSAKEAEVRLVGQIGGEAGRYVYGLAFVDPQLEFWPMEFPPPEDFEPAGQQIALECTFCHSRQAVEHHEIEEDVYSVNGNILRFCNGCGTSTPWIKSPDGTSATSGNTRERPDEAAVVPDSHLTNQQAESVLNLDSGISKVSPGLPISSAPRNSSLQIRSAAASDFADVHSDVQPSAYSAASLETVPTAAVQVVVTEAKEPRAEAASKSIADAMGVPARRPLDPHGRPVNRRKHMRVRVNFSACVRQSPLDNDIVECENVSKGGICFRSRTKYRLGETIEIAAPFSPGAPALFVPAKIRRAESLGDGFFRYGVAYLQSNSA